MLEFALASEALATAQLDSSTKEIASLFLLATEWGEESPEQQVRSVLAPKYTPRELATGLYKVKKVLTRCRAQARTLPEGELVSVSFEDQQEAILSILWLGTRHIQKMTGSRRNRSIRWAGNGAEVVVGDNQNSVTLHEHDPRWPAIQEVITPTGKGRKTKN